MFRTEASAASSQFRARPTLGRFGQGACLRVRRHGFAALVAAPNRPRRRRSPKRRRTSGRARAPRRRAPWPRRARERPPSPRSRRRGRGAQERDHAAMIAPGGLLAEPKAVAPAQPYDLACSARHTAYHESGTAGSPARGFRVGHRDRHCGGVRSFRRRRGPARKASRVPCPGCRADMSPAERGQAPAERLLLSVDETAEILGIGRSNAYEPPASYRPSGSAAAA